MGKITFTTLKHFRGWSLFFIISFLIHSGCQSSTSNYSELEKGFLNPPDAARPGVYWYFMDGNRTKEAMTKDLESMKEVGIGNLVYLEVNVGVPRGDVDFLSEEWKELFKHAVDEAERLGIEITLGVGPGWTGSGGPWVSGEQSMQHLVSTQTMVSGSGKKIVNLPKPPPKRPYFGEWGFTPEARKQWENFYEDVAVLAFPTPDSARIIDIDEKALYYRQPYSSVINVKQYIPAPAVFDTKEAQVVVNKNQIIDLTGQLQPDGTLEWDIPEGNWIVMRFGSRNNGAVTRPAPLPGVGLEADKFDTIALNAHLDKFTGELFKTIGKRNTQLSGGLKMLHMDSWEMGAQNWTARFREEFEKRRGYDPQPFYPVYAGFIVENNEISERFLWDLRLTSQELILENHAGHIKKYGHRHGLGLSIEPYDMNPTADLELAAVADMPMCEFWSVEYGYNTAFSVVEGSSISHLIGQSVVPAEAFTAHHDGWRQHPGSMKDQTDWAFASGVNRLVYHTFQHQSLNDNLRPGMTMGPYGVHWDRNQTWWPMASGYHQYVSRSQYLLQQGRTVADILYLAPEGAPHVFRAPESAFDNKLIDMGDQPHSYYNGRPPSLPDHKGYNFDACPPSLLFSASVKNNMIVFPSGMSYRMLVLPSFETMTPLLLEKIYQLVEEGATIVGLPPKKSPGLENYPECDKQVESKARELWGDLALPTGLVTKTFGKGKVIWGKEIVDKADNLYPHYSITASVLESMGIPEDFTSSGQIRYAHRTLDNCDIYFLANRTEKPVKTNCTFRIEGYQPELWNPVTGEMRLLPDYSQSGKQTTVNLNFDAYESYFIIFRQKAKPKSEQKNFKEQKIEQTLSKPWLVSFDPAWGGPAQITFDQLTDWSKHANEGIKYYSGTAVYTQEFDLPNLEAKQLFLDLGKVKNMARVKLNGEDMGIAWTAPWQVNITKAVKEKGNKLEIEVINLWPNRLIGDEQLPDDGIQNGKWPEWLTKGEPRTSGRYTFTTYKHFTKDSPLLESGLLGPVTIKSQQ